jgi:radical SAM protein with 4Fe4S-binding SPASM domain
MLREQNRLLNPEEYRQGKTHLNSRPQYLIVELTQGCNLHCPMCRSEVITPKSRLMSEAVFQGIAEELFSTAEMVDLRGWGESLILPNIRYYIETAASYGVVIRFVTNLSYERDEILDLLVKHGCYLSISVDTPDPDLFAQLRRGGNLAKVERNLRKLSDAYRSRFGSTERINLTTTVQRPALETLPDLIDFAARIGIEEIRLFSVTAPCDSPLALDNHEAEIDGALAPMQERSKLHGVKLVAGTKLGSLPHKQSDVAPCFHPWSYAYFAYDGSVGFCDHLIGPDGAKFILGNLNHSSFEEIWNGAAWQALRQEHITTRSTHAPHFEECSWCYKNRYVDFEHLFLPEAKDDICRL